MSNVLNIPNILTLSRIVLLPGFIGGFYMRSNAGFVLSFVVFVICCITDYLDGYLARAYKQTTEIGKWLDPLADKVLVLVAVLYMIGFNMISQYSLIPVAITVCREVIISSLRGRILTCNSDFKTSLLAKCKTAFQMTALAVIFIAHILDFQILRYVGEVLLWCSALLAILSGIQYFKNFFVTDCK